jgi:hypothetical protein
MYIKTNQWKWRKVVERLLSWPCLPSAVLFFSIYSIWYMNVVLCYLTLTLKLDIDLCHRHLLILLDLLPHHGEHLSQIILKSRHACRSYTPDMGFCAYCHPRKNLDLLEADRSFACHTSSLRRMSKIWTGQKLRRIRASSAI